MGEQEQLLSTSLEADEGEVTRYPNENKMYVVKGDPDCELTVVSTNVRRSSWNEGYHKSILEKN